MTLAVTVTNSGTRTGTDVVQIYATLPSAAAAEPRRLVAFRKVSLVAKASTRVEFSIPAGELSVWKSSAWTLVPGIYTLATAHSSRDITAQRTVTVS